MIRETKTKFGWVRGIPCTAPGVVEYRGIPYAAPPVGENRFREPQPCKPWEGVRECASYGPACMQLPKPEDDFFYQESLKWRFSVYPLNMSEDCLYLNVWTPAGTAEEKLPVLVWVHGGGYTRGFGHEPRSNGEVFASKGIVVVSVNYRLNLFGFFKHPELSAEQGHSGNYALLDTAAAVNWVYENIASFGGDPENITVYGQSAGAKTVECLTVMPQTKGKMAKAIMSSCAFDAEAQYDWEFDPPEDVEKNGIDFMQFSGKNSIAELRALSAEELLDCYRAFLDAGYPDFRCVCEDGYALHHNPGREIAAGKAHIQALLIGCTFEETMLRPIRRDITAENYQEEIEKLPAALASMKEIPVNTDEEASRYYNTWYSWYNNNVNFAICHNLRAHGKQAYSYSFQRRIPGKDQPGAHHSGDLYYAFGNLHNNRRPYTEEDFELEQRMNGYWVNFVKYGNPNGENLPRWEVFEPEVCEAMILNVGTCKMGKILPPGGDALYRSLKV